MTKDKRRDLEHGELTRIIIGTVVASGDHGGINARKLTEKLNSWGYRVTLQQMATRLAELAAEGRIDRIERGRYEGV
jgi:hypothetical protein